MKIGSLDLPTSLIASLQAERLVIFAGAGVSIPHPSNLPSFPALVKQIAGDENPCHEPGAWDRYLGCLQTTGLKVRQRAADILSDPDSKHSSLHRDLLRLFRASDKIKLVTTNFDHHFEAAFKTLWPEGCVKRYEAPALPPGTKVSGLFYLHGRLGHDPQDLVLTDSDFGRAYLTEGWARRFLTDMYAHHDVLFVGYNHKDPIVDHLARALPAGDTDRFALTDGDTGRWQHLGIKPIKYQPDNEHSALSESLTVWADIENLSFLEHEKQSAEILGQPLSKATETQLGYLEYLLTSPEHVRIFYRHASHADWLRWARDKAEQIVSDDRGHLVDQLFRQDLQGDKAARPQADWFADLAISGQGDPLHATLTKERLDLAPIAASAIARRLFVSLAGNTPPEPHDVARWLIWLNRPPTKPHRYLGLALGESNLTVDSDWAINVFADLTRPYARHKERFDFGDEDSPPSTTVELDLPGNARDLHDAWARTFKPALPELAGTLLPIVHAHLEQAHTLRRASATENNLWGDPENWRRSSIPAHPQDENANHRAFNVLIEAARDILDWYLQHDPATAQSIVNVWTISQAPLVRRLGIYGLAQSNATPAEKLKRAAAWLGEPHVKHELFFLLRKSYPHAGRYSRQQLLHRAARTHLRDHRLGKPLARDSAENKELHNDIYEYYNLLYWLSQAAPDCSLLEPLLARLTRLFPQFGPREHPDLDHWFGGVHSVTIESPVALKQLSALTPEDFLATLEEVTKTSRAADSRNHDIEGLLSETAKLVAQDFSWSYSLSEYLVEHRLRDNTAWTALAKGWREATLQPGEWTALLELLNAHPALLARHAKELVELLQSLVDPQAEPDEATVLRSLDTAHQLWDTASESPPPEIHNLPDWFQLAVNHPAGKLAQYAVSASSILRNSPTLPEPELVLDLLERMAASSNKGAPFARIVLCSRLPCLFNAFESWALGALLPLLDWKTDATQARQAWDGLLWNQNVSPALWESLKSHTISTYDHQGELGENQTRFAELIAYVTTQVADDPIKEAELSQFLRKASTDVRVAYASAISERLAAADEGWKEGLWQRWLKEYLTRRLEGEPPLESEEWNVMVGWPVSLSSLFDEAVELVTRWPVDESEHEMHSDHLADQITHLEGRLGHLEGHEEAIGRLLLHLLGGVGQQFYYWGEVEKIVRCIDRAGVDRGLLQRILNKGASRGWQGAGNYTPEPGA